MEEITLADYQALSRKAPKYGNRKEKRDGYSFDSAAEARRYDQLCLLVKSGVISDLAVHPVFELQPAFVRGGKRYRAIHYTGDFSYCEGGRVVCEDTKGKATDLFLVKEKLFRYRYPEIDLRIIEAK